MNLAIYLFCAALAAALLASGWQIFVAGKAGATPAASTKPTEGQRGTAGKTWLGAWWLENTPTTSSARGAKTAHLGRGPKLFTLNPKIVTKASKLTDRAAFPPGHNQNQNR
jgi:hypothetical protein